MSLATRCTECGTVFRVVQDQLKVSEGWVRCGRCSAVFNALENLCELDGETAGGVAMRLPAGTEPVSEPAALVTEASGGPQPAAADEEALAQGAEATTLPYDDSPAAIVSFSSESLPDDDRPPAPPAAAPVAAPEPAAPQFVQAAERAAFWRRPAVRSGLVATALLLSATLALQLALAGRDWLAAHAPASRPLLSAACDWLDCSIQPLKRIAQLSVDSSGLARLESAAVYRLSVVLRNRAETAVATPAMDLSLTDGSGQLVSRRVLLAADLGLPPVIEAGQELPLQALLSTGERRVSGYTVELFYP